MEGNRRRNPHDAGDAVDESPWGSHIEKASFERSEEEFFWLALGWFRNYLSSDEKVPIEHLHRGCNQIKCPLNLNKWTRVTEILGMFGDSIAIKTSMARICHQIFYLLLFPLFP